MSKIILTSGCSMTEGSELGNVKFGLDEKKYGPNTTRRSSYLTPEHVKWMEDHSWAGQLGQLCGLEVKNVAHGGSANKSIVRRAMLEVLELKKKYHADEILVIIGFSNLKRFEVFYQGIPCNITDVHKKYYWSAMQDNPEIVKFLELREKWFSVDAWTAIGDHINDVIALSSFLRCEGVKFVFFHAVITDLAQLDESSVEAVKINRQLNELHNVAFNDWWYWPSLTAPSNLTEWISQARINSFHYWSHKNSYRIGNGFHPLEEAHADWAKMLKTELENRKFI